SPRWPYIWRQGAANLFRPNNRTLLLTLSLGLGTFLILTIFLVQRNLLGELIPQSESKANAILFEVQSDQLEAVRDILKPQNLPLIQEASLVTMKINSVTGQSVSRLQRDRKIPRWILRREYRSTSRDYLEDTEQLVAGKWPATNSPSADHVPISVEAD